MTDADREDEIRAVGRRIEAAHAAGDKATARGFLALQAGLIAGRSPAAQAEADREFFTEEGERARREAILKELAA